MRRPSWRRFIGAAALLASYAGWMIAGDSPLTRARKTIGRLPELTPGFHRGEPASTLSRLGEAREDYLWLQAFDLVLVALAAMTALLALALVARKAAAPLATLWLMTLVPAAFAAAELIENALLALFASGATATALAFVQQAATTLKFVLAALTFLFSFSFLAALGDAHPRLGSAP